MKIEITGARAEAALEAVRRTLGGFVRVARQRTTTGRVIVRWEANGRAAADALARIRPLLRVKRAEAAIATRFARAVDSRHGARHTPRTRAVFERMKARLEQTRRDATG